MRLGSQAFARRVARKKLVLEKHSPTILLGVGVVGMVGSTVLACRATLKLDETLHEIKEKQKLARAFFADDEVDYTEEDRARDIRILYIRGAVQVAVLYAPAFAIGAASVACLSKSHNILTRRNAALTAAYVALEKGFAEYRARVVQKMGPEADRDFRYGTEMVPAGVDSGGKPKTVTRVAPGEPSIYARFFDPLSPSWCPQPEYNLIFLKAQQNYANDLLHAQGHLFLNEVYRMLGIPHSEAGSVVGWVMMGRKGDNYIDFGIFNGDDHNVRDFVNGREGSILLDFNVDGVIYNLIERREDEGPWQE